MKSSVINSCRAARKVLLALASAATLSAFGGEVTAERAVNATSAWIARSPAPTRLPTGDVRTFSMNGTNAFHLVVLRGGGWAAMPADDVYEPVIAFNPDADALIPDEDDGNPTWDVIANYVDMGAFEEGEREVWGVNDRPRFSVSAATVSSKTSSGRTVRTISSSSKPEPCLTWASLDSDTAGADAWKRRVMQTRAVVKYDGTPADVRVAPLTKTKWNQSGVKGEYCYNYYVPNYYPCGCVATAMAQLMYYYKWPLTPMPTGDFEVSVDDVKKSFPMERGTTGCFRWESMVLCPNEAESLSEENRKAIGMLTYNCGLAVKMKYAGSGSGAWTGDAAEAFKKSFNYANADCVTVDQYRPSSAFKGGLLPCLDAAQPCCSEVKGHEVVSDGYAFSEGCLFVHMNMGWGGSSDAYYRQYIIGHNRTLRAVICNVSTNDIPRYASGRVTDALGNPVEGATVRASIPAYGDYAATEQTVSTDSRGIYAIRVQSGNCNISISAAKEGTLVLQESCTAKISTSDEGNSWGNDFVLVNRDDLVEWTSEGDGTMFGDPANWSCGRVPGNDDVIAFGAATPAFVTNDIPNFAPASVVFLQECPKVEIGGLAIQGVVAMASTSAERPVFATEVAFADTIDVSGAIEFKGGVQGTYPINHDVYYGDYHLTTEDWWHPPALATVPAGSKLYVQNYEGASIESLVIEKNGVVVVDNAMISGVSGYLLTRNKGKFTARNGLVANSSEQGRLAYEWGDSSGGVFELYSLSSENSADIYLKPEWTVVVGAGGISGSKWRAYYDTGRYVTLYPSADYDISGVISDLYSSYSSNKFTLNTSDYATGEPRKVTVADGGSIVGVGFKVEVKGNGTLRIASDKCTFGGGLVMYDGTTLETDSGCQPGNGDVIFNRGSSLALAASCDTALIVSGAAKLSGSGSKSVGLRYGDGTETMPSGKYIVLYAANGVNSSVASAFALRNPIADGATASFAVVDGKKLVLTVARSGETAPAVPLRDAIWLGEAGDGKFSNPSNWLGGNVPGTGAKVTISAKTATTLVCDIANFDPGSIIFGTDSKAIVIDAADGGSIVNLGAIMNNSSATVTLNVPVHFAEDIDKSGNGAIVFAAGAWGALPVNHNMFYGVYNIEATEWTLSSAIIITEGSSLLAQNTVITETAAQLILGESGSHFKAKELVYHSIKGYAFGPFAGEAEIGKIDFDKKKWYGFNVDFTGMLRAGSINFYSTPESGKEGDYLRFHSNGRFVIGSKTGDSYLKGSRGTFNLREADATLPLVLNSAADWDLIAVAPGAGAQLGHGFAIESQGVVIDTSDFDGAETGHTVTVKKSGNPESVLKGAGYLAASGNGTLKFDTSCTFTGGLVASNGVTVALANGVTPGNGDVTMAGGTTLAIPDTANCTATVAGEFKIGEPGGTIGIRLGTGSNQLAVGRYKVLTANGGFENAAADSFSLVNPMVSGAAATFEIDGNELWLNVAEALRHGVWVAGNGDFDDPDNWEDKLVPQAGDALDFSGVTGNITINCNSDAAFGAVTMGSSVITFTGSFMATSFSDTSKVAVGENSTVTLDGDLVFAGTAKQYIVYTVAAGGRFVVTGRIEASSLMTGGQVFQYVNPGEGAVQAKGLVANEGTSDERTFRLSSDSDGTANWIVGADGLSGSKYFFIPNNSNKKAAIQPLDSDFDITTQVGIRAPLTFNTTGYDGNGHTITIAPAGVIGRDGALTISGTGKVLVDATNTLSSAVTVTNTATLAIKAGKQVTTGKTSIASGAALELPDSASASVVLAGGLVFGDGEGHPVLSLGGLSANVTSLVVNATKLTYYSNKVAVRFATAPEPGTYTILSAPNKDLNNDYAGYLMVEDPELAGKCTFAVSPDKHSVRLTVNGYTDGDGNGGFFNVLDSTLAKLPAGVTDPTVKPAGSVLSYAQADALGFLSDAGEITNELAVVSMTFNDNNQPVLSVSGAPNAAYAVTYSLLATDDLASGLWTEVEGSSSATGIGLVDASDAADRKFYKVKAVIGNKWQ